jgi:hypothetical protein
MSPLPDAIIGVFAAFAPLVSARVWRHAQLLRQGARRPPGARTVTAVWRAMGWAPARHCTNDHRVLNRAPGSARQGRPRLLGQLITRLVPSAATSGLGADDSVARRSGWKIAAQGGYRAALRSTQSMSSTVAG